VTSRHQRRIDGFYHIVEGTPMQKPSLVGLVAMREGNIRDSFAEKPTELIPAVTVFPAHLEELVGGALFLKIPSHGVVVPLIERDVLTFASERTVEAVG
jgi:hypothetical protein